MPSLAQPVEEIQSITSGNGKNKPQKPLSEKTNLAKYSTATPFFETETQKNNLQTMQTAAVKTNSLSINEEGIPLINSMTFRGPEKNKSKPIGVATVENLMVSQIEGLPENIKKSGSGARLGVFTEDRNFMRKNSTTKDLPELITTPSKSKNTSTPNLEAKDTTGWHHVVVDNTIKSLTGIGSERTIEDKLIAKNSSREQNQCTDLEPPVQNYYQPASKIIITGPEEPTHVAETLVVNVAGDNGGLIMVNGENYLQSENLAVEEAQLKEFDMTSASNVERNEI
jgi:hypothetical protein